MIDGSKRREAVGPAKTYNLGWKVGCYARGALVKDRLSGWDEIAKYIDVNIRTAQKYELTRGLKVYRIPGGKRSGVFALRSDVDAWLLGKQNPPALPASESRRGVIRDSAADFTIPVLDHIVAVARGIKLYRRDYILRFDLTRSTGGIEARIYMEYEVRNPTSEPQLYAQVITIDDTERGHIERMSCFVDDKPLYDLRRPAPAENFVGYSEYRGSEQLIEPDTAGFLYECRSSWVIHRVENDIWYNHMVLPTIGITVATSAPPEFEITRSFKRPDLVMKGDHIDVAWSRRVKLHSRNRLP